MIYATIHIEKEVIFMRTPCQIKRALARCRDDRCICDECIFSDGNVKKWRDLMGDALEYIRELENCIENLKLAKDER